MKKIIVAVFVIPILIIGTVFFLRSGNQMSNKNFLSYDEVAEIYYDNKEIINSIKDGLFSSGFIPHDGMTTSGFNSNIEKSVFLRYDYEKGQLFCSNDPHSEKLQSIQNVHGDAIEYFMRINEDFNPSIGFRKIRNIEDTIIEFEFRNNEKKSDIHAGIIYTTVPEKLWGEIHLEDNWHVYRYGMP